MTNEPENEVLVFSRNRRSGELTFENAVSTNGKGLLLDGFPQDDALASQANLVVAGKCLLAVNAGSNTISSFRIRSKTRSISLAATVDSRGEIPVSIAENGGLVYVLNAGGVGSIAGFKMHPKTCMLKSIGDPTALNQTFASGPPALAFFAASPAQIIFTPEGNLLVTIKANDAQLGDDTFPSNGSLNLYKVDEHGLTSAEDLIQTEIPGITIPFSGDYDDEGNFLLVELFPGGFPEGGASGRASLWSGIDSSSPTVESSVEITSQRGVCWLRYSPRTSCAFTTNNGSASISALRVQDGELELVEAVAASGVNSPTEITFSPDYKFLYALSTGFTLSDDPELRQPAIFVYRVRRNCSLSLVQEITNGIPTEAERVPGNLGVVNGVVGLAAF